MNTRRLGKTGLFVSEIGFGGEWLERHPEDESIELIRYAASKGVNLLDCWMPDPKSRDIIGKGIHENRAHWIIQGHVGSTWKDGQYFRTRDMRYVKPAFEDLLRRMQTDYIDLGMIHYVDSEEEWEKIQHSDYLDYVMELKRSGTIRHIGLSSHNPRVAWKAALSGYVEMILFSINPAFDMLPASENIDTLFADSYDASLRGIDADRALLYRTCEQNDVGITVMKGFAGGRLFDEKRSPFGVRLTPVQCIHYALTRPAVGSILCGYDTKEQLDEAVGYETASEAEKDYASVLANAPLHSYRGECTYAATASPARLSWISRRSTSSTIWPPCSRRFPRRCSHITSCWRIKPRSASAVRPARAAARSVCRSRSGCGGPPRFSAADKSPAKRMRQNISPST